jgi:hypothetical protein
MDMRLHREQGLGPMPETTSGLPFLFVRLSLRLVLARGAHRGFLGRGARLPGGVLRAPFTRLFPVLLFWVGGFGVQGLDEGFVKSVQLLFEVAEFQLVGVDGLTLEFSDLVCLFSDTREEPVNLVLIERDDAMKEFDIFDMLKSRHSIVEIS